MKEDDNPRYTVSPLTLSSYHLRPHGHQNSKKKKKSRPLEGPWHPLIAPKMTKMEIKSIND